MIYILQEMEVCLWIRFLIKNNLIDEIKNFQNKIIGLCKDTFIIQESEESQTLKV